MKENKGQITIKLATGVTAFMLTMSPVLAGTVGNVYAEEIKTTSVTEKQYKEGTFIENYKCDGEKTYHGYVVKRGDTTSRISEKTSKYLKAEKTTKYWPVIAYLNDYPRTIKPGEVIIFPNNIEDMNELLSNLKSSNWVSKYIQYNGIYKNKKKNITIGEVIDQIYGKGASQDPTFVRKYLKTVGMDPAKFNSTSELNSTSYFKLTDWIPTTEELGMESTTVQKSRK